MRHLGVEPGTRKIIPRAGTTAPLKHRWYLLGPIARFHVEAVKFALPRPEKSRLCSAAKTNTSLALRDSTARFPMPHPHRPSRQGVAAIILEAKRRCASWPFDVREITTPMRIVIVGLEVRIVVLDDLGS